MGGKRRKGYGEVSGLLVIIFTWVICGYVSFVKFIKMNILDLYTLWYVCYTTIKVK